MVPTIARSSSVKRGREREEGMWPCLCSEGERTSKMMRGGEEEGREEGHEAQVEGKEVEARNKEATFRFGTSQVRRMSMVSDCIICSSKQRPRKTTYAVYRGDSDLTDFFWPRAPIRSPHV
jgi:hypothetical protein